jgi:hypothetical protein
MDGLKSKNGKQRAECLDDLGLIIRDYGLGVLQVSMLLNLFFSSSLTKGQNNLEPNSNFLRDL